MRISEKITNAGQKTRVYTSGKVQNSADRRGAASAVNGTRQFSIVTPGGMEYIPRQNEDAVMLSEGQEQLCIGVRMMTNRFDTQPGEVALFSAGGASVEIKNDGKIYLTGRVFINGTEIGVE